jgi:hypothetical protein
MTQYYKRRCKELALAGADESAERENVFVGGITAPMGTPEQDTSNFLARLLTECDWLSCEVSIGPCSQFAAGILAPKNIGMRYLDRIRATLWVMSQELGFSFTSTG